MRCGASKITVDWRASFSRPSSLRALLRLARQEAGEREARGAGVARHAQRGDRAAGARQRHHAVAGGGHHLHQHRARVGDGRRAGVADVGHALARGQARAHLRGAGALVVLVQRQQRLFQAEMAQEGAAGARILAADDVGQRERVQRAQADVGEVADGRGHHVEAAARVVLQAGHGGGRLQRLAQADGGDGASSAGGRQGVIGHDGLALDEQDGRSGRRRRSDGAATRAHRTRRRGAGAALPARRAGCASSSAIIEWRAAARGAAAKST